MAHLFIKHKVQDYPVWKKVFDGFDAARRAGGERSYQILHPDDDKNSLLSLFEWDNLNNARKFVGSRELKDAMSDAGVIEQPEIYFLEEYDSGRL